MTVNSVWNAQLMAATKAMQKNERKSLNVDIFQNVSIKIHINFSFTSVAKDIGNLICGTERDVAMATVASG